MMTTRDERHTSATISLWYETPARRSSLPPLVATPALRGRGQELQLDTINTKCDKPAQADTRTSGKFHTFKFQSRVLLYLRFPLVCPQEYFMEMPIGRPHDEWPSGRIEYEQSHIHQCPLFIQFPAFFPLSLSLSFSFSLW